MTAHVAHDPFARQSLHREPRGIRSCDWCGQYRRTFTYTVESDDRGCRPEGGRSFCGLDCYRAYTT